MTASQLQGLTNRQKIVNPDGTPTEYFLRLLLGKDNVLGPLSGSKIVAGTGLSLNGGDGLLADGDVQLSAVASAILDELGTAQGDILYRDALAWKVLAPGTAGNFLKTNGASANPSWAAGGGGGTPWWLQPPAAAGFSFMTSDGTVNLTLTDDTDEGLLIDSGAPTANSGTQGRFCYKTLSNPTLAWDFKIKYEYFFTAQNFTFAGIAPYNSSNGRHNRFGTQNNGSALNIDRMSGISSYSTTLYADGSGDVPLPYWMRITSDGTTLNYYCSCNGKIWSLVFSEALATYLTAGGGNADRICFCLGLTRTSGPHSLANIQYWSLTGPGV